MTITRTCPVCSIQDCVPFASEKIDLDRLNGSTYSSRKEPEFMRLRLVRCRNCDLVYAPSPPTSQFLSTAYSEADYDSLLEASDAAKTYSQILAHHIKSVPHRFAAIDVGAGSGPLLPWLQQQSFSPVLGIEPSKSAIAAAPLTIQPLLTRGVFSPNLVRHYKISLVCSFMTLEHILNPFDFAQSVYQMLQPGGALALVVHDRSFWLNRMLGKLSPIFDIEHVQLFNRSSLKALLRRSGYEEIRIVRLRNSYPLRYWLRLMPLPHHLKRAILQILVLLRIDGKPCSLDVGNLFAIANRRL